MRFRVLVFRVQGLGFRDSGLGFWFWMVLGFGIQDFVAVESRL